MFKNDDDDDDDDGDDDDGDDDDDVDDEDVVTKIRITLRFHAMSCSSDLNF